MDEHKDDLEEYDENEEDPSTVEQQWSSLAASHRFLSPATETDSLVGEQFSHQSTPVTLLPMHDDGDKFDSRMPNFGSAEDPEEL